MSDPWGRAPQGPPPIRCPVCGTENEATRQFCRKCASALHPGRGPAVVEPEPERRLSPLMIGGVAALVLLAIAAVAAFALLSGGAEASPSPPAQTFVATAAPTPAPTPATPGPTVPTTPETTPTPDPAPTSPPTPEPPTTPTILSFDVPRRADCSDPSFPGTIRVSWEVAAAEGATLAIDGTGIFASYTGTTGFDDVPFSCGEESHTYLLRTVGGSGPPDAEEAVVRRR